MRKSDRVSLLVIGAAMLALSPVNMASMLWDGTIQRTLNALYFGLFSWGLVAIGACLMVYALLGDED